jgi:hypothetical protein
MFSIKTFPFEIEGTKLGRILTLPGHNLPEEKLLIGDTITGVLTIMFSDLARRSS